jgi:hypothetical protein
MNILRQLWRWFGGERKRAAPASAPRRPVLEVLEERTACAVIGSQIPPSSLSGFVYCDMNRNGVRDAGDTGIAGVPIALFRGSRVVAVSFTGLDGSYHFNHLQPGTYTIFQGDIPPSTTMLFSEGIDNLGTIRGVSRRNWGLALQDDTFRNIRLGNAQTGTNYNFGELCTPAVPGISILKFLNGMHVTAAPGPDETFATTVTFTYDVPNTGNVPLSNVTLTDQFVFTPKLGFPVVTGTNSPVLVAGDTNGNGLLDPGEVWVYQATEPVPSPLPFPVAGTYHNVVTVTATAPNGATVTASDQSFYHTSGGTSPG